ncbi:MAG: helix-turn-helix transcriptional regulator [Clostridia bacterium]|nr:helix-turn-helix transcriptional regulator [Clostridia bacterium]
MIIADINPFIRYADSYQFTPAQPFSYARDCRLFYLQSGSITFHIDGQSHAIGDGTLLLWRGGQCYRFELNGAVRMTILNFDYTRAHAHLADSLRIIGADSFDPAQVLEALAFEDCPALSGFVCLPGMQGAEEELAAIVRDFNEGRLLGREAACARLKLLLTDIARRVLTGTEKSDTTVERVLAFLRENYARPLTNHEIAQIVNYHEFYVNKLIVRHTGMTLHRYLTHIRVGHAARLLMTTDDPVSKIAEDCGFTSPAYFADAFRRTMGVTPGEYRKQRGGAI